MTILGSLYIPSVPLLLVGAGPTQSMVLIGFVFWLLDLLVDNRLSDLENMRHKLGGPHPVIVVYSGIVGIQEYPDYSPY